ncbi:MAG: ABC transporter ATP-binding protein [Planctomycetota bacterium]|jgi:iron complex transport system ATP-binding protein
MSAIIKVENLSFGYRLQEAILKDVSFEVIPGTFLAIAGPNGAGKTTLLNLLCRLLNPGAGSINIDAVPIDSYSVKILAQKIAVVRQEFVPVFDFTVAQVVSMARTPYLGTFGFESQADKKFINEALEMTDTAQFSSRPLAELSGGERQRIFIARALAQNTPILLLDEPTAFLDLKHQVGIYDLLKSMQLEKGKTIVAVTHDINLGAQYADVTLLLGADSSYQYGYARDVFSAEQIERVFGVRGFTGRIGQEKFFIPLGEFAKDSSQIDRKQDNSG